MIGATSSSYTHTASVCLVPDYPSSKNMKSQAFKWSLFRTGRLYLLESLVQHSLPLSHSSSAYLVPDYPNIKNMKNRLSNGDYLELIDCIYLKDWSNLIVLYLSLNLIWPCVILI